MTISNHTSSRSDQFSAGFFKQLLVVASGEGTGNHADLRKFEIHAITLRTINVSYLHGLRPD